MVDGPRVLDPEALDRKRDARGRASIVVPRKWMREGARLEVALPSKVRCDLCDGGGCDACARSGAYVLPENRAPIAITLPRVTDDVFAVRVTNPFVDEEPRLLVVRVAAGEEASSGVRFLAPNHDVDVARGGMPPNVPQLPNVPSWVKTFVLVVITALAALLLHRACG